MKYRNISCCYCNSNRFLHLWGEDLPGGFLKNDYLLRVVICQQCGLIFQNQRMTRNDLDKYYQNTAYYYNCAQIDIIPKRLNQIERIRKLFDKYKILQGKLLDVGCYSGQLMSYFKKYGWDVYGIEPNRAIFNKIKRKYKDKVINENIENLNDAFQNNFFNIAVFNHVLEHVDNPVECIDMIRKYIVDNGFLYIEVPDVENIPRDIISYFSVEHLTYFTKKTLVNLIENRGFRKVVVQTQMNNYGDIEPNYPVIMSLFKKNSNNKKITVSFNYTNLIRTIDNLKRRRTKIIRKINHILSTTNPHRKIAVWGAGVHTSVLYGACPNLRKRIKSIFDNTPFKHGKKFLGVRIYNEADINRVKPHTIIISSYASEKEIVSQLKSTYPYIKIITLYN